MLLSRNDALSFLLILKNITDTLRGNIAVFFLRGLQL